MNLVWGQWPSKPKFFDPRKVAGEVEERNVEWKAFPKRIRKKEMDFPLADNPNLQDEYCEWRVEREGGKTDGRIVRVVFTTEMQQVCLILYPPCR